jgi:uncharacterized protein YjiS (DUF1127 family)
MMEIHERGRTLDHEIRSSKAEVASMSLIPDRPTARNGLSAVGLDRDTPPLRRTAEGRIDYDFYLTRSRNLRAAAFTDAFRATVRGLGRLGTGLIAAWKEWRAHRRAVSELLSLDDRTLRDLGLNRAGLGYVVDHGREDAPAPANTNTRSGSSPKAA